MIGWSGDLVSDELDPQTNVQEILELKGREELDVKLKDNLTTNDKQLIDVVWGFNGLNLVTNRV